MKYAILSLLFLLSTAASAAPALVVKGQVTKIEKGNAVLKTEKFGELLVNLKHAGKKNRSILKEAAGTKKSVSVILMASQIKKQKISENKKF
jgi:hypothetical protein